jgi:RNA polymerase sigma-70 factor (ECF subfamily)
MRALSADHRAVIGELFFTRRTIAETAQVLGVPPGTVKSRSFYALRALRDALEERGVTEP